MKTLFYAVLLLSSTQVLSTTDELDFVEESLVQREFADYDVFNATGIKLHLNKSLTKGTFVELELLTASDKAIDIDFSVSQWHIKTGFTHPLTARLTAHYVVGFGTSYMKYSDSETFALSGRYRF